MTHLSLFSGIGGIDLAAEWAGFETVAFVERDPFCQKVLAKHWPEVPIYDDVTTFDGTGFRGVDLVSGGFPCQPFSCAGKREGAGDERHLWPAMLRITDEARPRWVLAENVPGLLTIDGGRTFGAIVADLASLGYRVGWGVLSAYAVGACHIRQRVFIVGHSDGERCEELPDGIATWTKNPDGGHVAEPFECGRCERPGLRPSEPGRCGRGRSGDAHVEDLADADGRGLDGKRIAELAGEQGSRGGVADGRTDNRELGDATVADADGIRRKRARKSTGGDGPQEGGRVQVSERGSSDTGGGRCSREPRGRAGQEFADGYRELPSRDWRSWDIEPVVCSGDDGVPRGMAGRRVNQLKALGNAVVPQQVYPILAGIAEVEKHEKT